MNSTDQDWNYWQIPDGEDIRIAGQHYTGSLSGVLAATSCPEIVPLPLAMLEFLNFLMNSNLTFSSNGSTTFAFEFTEMDLTEPNQTFLSENITTYVDMSIKYCDSTFRSKYIVRAYIGLCVLFCMLISFGNTLVLVLPSISKSFRSPIFTTLLSFSLISLIHGFELLFYNLAQCSLLFIFEFTSALQCMLINCGRYFLVNVRSLHLCLLACQRIYLSLFPLKAIVYHTRTNVLRCIFCIYFSCVLIECFMGFQGLRDCAVDRSNPEWSTILKINADFIVLNLIVITLLSAGMLSGIIQKYTSPRISQSATQRSQSRIASIVLVLYVSFYCPLKLVVFVLQFKCVNPMYVGPISLTVSLAEFLLNALNPLILCLRVPEAKRALKDKFCRCIGKHT